VELYEYDEERGLIKIVLEKGTEIEILLKDEYGAITWVAGTVTSTQKGSLDFQVIFPGGAIDSGTWAQTRSRAEMEGTLRFPPALQKRQPGVHAILSTQGYTPWHHSQHGSHWLRLQPRGAWKYKTHNVYGIPQRRSYGWRMGLSMMNMDNDNSGGQDFGMRSFVEDHMSKEDLGPGTSTQDWTDLQNLGRELTQWEESINCMNYTLQERNRWSQVPPRAPDKKDPRTRPRGRKGKGKEISCFHASTRVSMFTITKGGPEYKRMDKLVKGDKLWTTR